MHLPSEILYLTLYAYLVAFISCYFYLFLLLSGSFMSSVGTRVAGAVWVFPNSKEWLDCSSLSNGISSGSRHEVFRGVSVKFITQCSINAFTGGLQRELLWRASCNIPWHAPERRIYTCIPIIKAKQKLKHKSKNKTEQNLKQQQRKHYFIDLGFPWDLQTGNFSKQKVKMCNQVPEKSICKIICSFQASLN